MKTLDQTLMALTLALTQVSRAYKAAADKMAGDYDLSQATAWPVVMIGRLGDGVRPGMVAEALGLEPSSVVRLIDQLVEAGLVKRSEDASDRRARTLHLTAEGRRRAAELEKALVAFRRTLFRGIARDDIDTCLAVLDSLGSAVRQYGDASANAGKP
ncbi:MarR family transcriptional regulator [Oxalobacteraceae bacterium OM1]|nr:MarR family transcriptional regulator [Oxalobacteraceae bacterium OM1]